MADAYWRYSDSRQPPSQSISQLVGKRSRADYGKAKYLGFTFSCSCIAVL